MSESSSPSYLSLSPGCSALLGRNHKTTQIGVAGNVSLTSPSPYQQTHQHLHSSFLLPLVTMKKSLSAYQGQFLPPWPDPIPAYLLRDLRSLRVFLLPSIFHLPISTRPFPSALLPIASHALPLQLLWHKPPLSILFSLNQSFNRLYRTTVVYQIPVTQTEICLMELTA